MCTSLDSKYIVGLVDGEGSFTVYIRNLDLKQKAKRRVMVEPKFYLKLIEKDKDVLYQLQQFFGCGSVYFQRDSRPNHQNCYRYEVFRHDDLLNVIIPFFKKNQLRFSSKKKDFDTFCLLMEMIKNKKHHTESGLRKMFAIKQTMH